MKASRPPGLGWIVVCLTTITSLWATPPGATPPSPPGPAWPPGGVPLGQPGDQFTGDVLGDGRGGAFVAWIDSSRGVSERDVYMQRVDRTGRIAWRTYLSSGLPVCTSPGRQFLVRLAPGGADGVIATWHDERGSNPDIYALRIDGDGTIVPSWSVGGVPICAAPGTQTDPVIAQDGSGGAFLAWEDFRNGFANGRIFAQRVLGAGSIANGWPADGIQLANGTGVEFQPAILPDLEGGAYVIWVRYWPAAANLDLIATRIASDGTIAPGWPDSGLAICSAPGRQDSPSIVPDQEGGFYATWQDYRDDLDPSDGVESDIYCQRVTASGEFPQGWGGDGIPVRVASGDESIPMAAPDGVGGLLVSWEVSPTGGPNVFVQRITSAGAVAPGWDPVGVASGTSTADGQAPALTGDGSGGAIVAWNDDQGAALLDVRAQRIASGGTRAAGWPEAGAPIATGSGNQQIGGSTALVSTVVGDGSGGAVIVWTDWGAGGGADVLVQRITAAGVVAPASCEGCDGIVSLAPNPGTGRFQVEVKGPETGTSADIKIYDVRGRLRRAIELVALPAFGISKLDLDLTEFPAGVYFLRYRTRGVSPLVGTRHVTIVR